MELSKIQVMGNVLSNELQDLLQELAFGVLLLLIDLSSIIDSIV